MNLRNASLSALLLLTACNGSNSSTPPTDTAASTFTDADAAALKANAEADAAAIKSKAEADAAALIDKTGIDAVTVLSDAKTKAEAALEKAALDAKAITDQAPIDAAKITDAANEAAKKLTEQAALEAKAIMDKAGTDLKALTDKAGTDTQTSKKGILDAKAITDAADKAATALKDKAALDAKTLTDKVVLEAQAIIDKARHDAGTTLADAGAEDAAFDLLAPKDYVLNERNIYATGISGFIQLESVDETASAKRHEMELKIKTKPDDKTIDKTIKFTARSGHLIAKGKGDTKAAIFYTVYTRDGLPHDKRPVTFFWNGGPGSGSIWLHLGSWGPKYLKSDAPKIPEENYLKQPTEFPLKDNAITLLDKSDLVFVDPPGTGLSTAIAPSTNKTFWGVDVDAQVIAGFITAFNNRYNRQASPKYLYGESYGGIRTPIVADILLKAGTNYFEKDPSGKPAVVLNGIILNSPLLDYTHYCDMNGYRSSPSPSVSCAGFFPSYAMTANFFDLPKARNVESREVYLRSIEDFVDKTYLPTLKQHSEDAIAPVKAKTPATSGWSKFAATVKGQDFVDDLYARTGIAANVWKIYPNMHPDKFREYLINDKKLGRFDSRMTLPSSSPYEPDNYINVAFENELKTYLPDFLNYRGLSPYASMPEEPINKWNWEHRGSAGSFSPASTQDLMEALAYNPSLKLLVLHGFEDTATPGFQTERDLKALTYKKGEGAADKTMLDRMPVKWFEGGHMIYNTEESRAPLNTLLDEYYDNPTYSIPATAVATN